MSDPIPTTTDEETVTVESSDMQKDDKPTLRQRFQAAKMFDIVRNERELEEGESPNDEFYDRCPLNFKQPSLFELTRRETLRKMGKVSKEAVLQKLLQKVIFIRDCDIQKKELDPIVTEEFREQELSISTDKEKLGVSKSDCPNNLPHCRLGCVCVSCPDIYEEFYEKHCRDTGDPDCLHGCICENPGPHLNNGESKWIKSKPYKYKKQRVRDDDDCGFVPIHMREQMREGRPKRKAQAPTRYRPDFGVSEKEMRAYENGNSNSNSNSANGIPKNITRYRPHRRLFDKDDDECGGSDDSDERIITDKKRKVVASGTSGPSAPKKGRPTKQQAAKNLRGPSREPSKRERKPRNLDLPEPEPRRKRPLKKTDLVNGVDNASPTVWKGKTEPVEEVEETKGPITVPLGTSLHVIDIQPASKTCQGMYAVLRKNTSEIVTFVTWDEGSNSRPYLLDLKYRFTSSRQSPSDLEDGNDVLTLPQVKTEDTMWIFYSIKRNFMNWDTIMCRELHSVIKSCLLVEVLERHRPAAMKAKVSRVVDISFINANKREEPAFRCPPLYLYVGKHGDVYWFGRPPRIYVEKNIDNVGANSNVLVKRRQHVQRHYRNTSLRKLKPKLENNLALPANPGGAGDAPVLNNSITITPEVEKGQDQENVPMKITAGNEDPPNAVEIKPCGASLSLSSSVPELTTPEVLPPSPAPNPGGASDAHLLNNNITITPELEKGQDQEKVPMEVDAGTGDPPDAVEIKPCSASLSLSSSVPELTTPEVLPPSPAPDPASSAPDLNEADYQALLDM